MGSKRGICDSRKTGVPKGGEKRPSGGGEKGDSGGKLKNDLRKNPKGDRPIGYKDRHLGWRVCVDPNKILGRRGGNWAGGGIEGSASQKTNEKSC